MKTEFPRDVKPGNFSGGQWKSRKIEKGQRASRTRSNVAKIYIVVPPIEGWPGGDPIKNGYKPV